MKKIMNRIINGDALSELRKLPGESVHMCVTSPPYWGLRDYGVEGQLGLEATPGEYITEMVKIFSEVKRVLRPEGTLWLNIADTYYTAKGACWKKSCVCSAENIIPAIVLDPFFGHGTTGLVAVKLGRQFIGIELNPEDCKAALARIEKGTAQQSLSFDGETI